MADLAIGLVADCDRPENDVEKIMRANLPNARTLPFVAFVTQATPAVQKKLAGFVAKSEKAAKKGSWKTVIRYALEADKTTGRCPERKQMTTLMNTARAWANGQLKAAVKSARSSDDTAAASKLVSNVKKKFAGQPEAVDASKGLKALRRLAKIQKIEASGSAPEGLREKAARDFKETRWASVFVKKSAAADGDDQEEPDESDDEDDEDSEIEIG